MGGAGVILVRARPMHTALAFDPFVRDASEVRRDPAHLFPDIGGVVVLPAGARRETQALLESKPQITDDPPIGPALADRMDGLPDSLDAPVGIGECPILLGE